MKKNNTLTASEMEILRHGVENPNAVLKYFLGMEFDFNYEPGSAWQEMIALCSQGDVTISGGFGSGKTLGIALGAIYWALMVDNFKFLNAAPRQWQAKQMYLMILTNAEGTRLNDFIIEKPSIPFPKIVIEFNIVDPTTLEPHTRTSTLEFMSADKNAVGILAWEGDWLNVDEAGLLDMLEDIIKNAGSRLRGSIRGRERLGRFSMTSNPWDNFAFWQQFDLADADPENYLSLYLSTRSNKNVTGKQLERMVRRVGSEEHERFIDGRRPEGRGRFFSKDDVAKCEDSVLLEIIQKKAETDPHYRFDKAAGVGVWHIELPPERGHLYILAGDPGADNAPKRNAPCLMVWDVSSFPAHPARLVAFWWGNGNTRILPFIEELFALKERYNPVLTAIDSTATQKAIADLINEYMLTERFGEEARTIQGLDFSGGRKPAFQQAGRLFVENRLLTWPAVPGIRSQLQNYDPDKDRVIAQDIVATLCMSAHCIRVMFHVNLDENREEDRQPDKASESRRFSEDGRSRRSPRARAKSEAEYPTPYSEE